VFKVLRVARWFPRGRTLNDASVPHSCSALGADGVVCEHKIAGGERGEEQSCRVGFQIEPGVYFPLQLPSHVLKL
jgi:hypothetical protein